MNVRKSQLCVVVTFAARRTTFSSAVGHVVGLSAKKQMRGINAARRIATMKHAPATISTGSYLMRDPMRLERLPTQGKNAVTVLIG